MQCGQFVWRYGELFCRSIGEVLFLGRALDDMKSGSFDDTGPHMMRNFADCYSSVQQTILFLK